MRGLIQKLALASAFTSAVALGVAAFPLQAWAVSPMPPGADDEVVEVLPAVTRHRPAALPTTSAQPTAADAAAAAQQAREDISVARQTGDTRYWGRAQAVLSPWWDAPDAPADIAVLQATVQQGRHEFDAARTVLTQALERTPGHAQGWLNLASLERLSARYVQALAACDAVARAGQPLYAKACRLETESLQGQHDEALKGLQALLATTRDAGQRSWLLSLLAEAQERAGRDGAAASAYAASLAAQPDLYTSIAFGDLLLRTGKPEAALKILASLPETDAVVLRRAAAWKRLDDPRWTAQRDVLKERVQELRRRGDDTTLHGRELALTALWLDDDPAQALQLATRNLRLQREPLDWWIAQQSAQQANQSAALSELNASISAAGLQDSRLGAGTTATPGAQP